MALKPLEDRVLIIQDEGKAETDAGIIIPEASRQKPSKGTIVSVGPGKPRGEEKPIGYMLNGEFLQSLHGKTISFADRVVPLYPTPYKEGDRVYFSRFSGVELEMEGKVYLCMRFTDLICIE